MKVLLVLMSDALAPAFLIMNLSFLFSTETTHHHLYHITPELWCKNLRSSRSAWHNAFFINWHPLKMINDLEPGAKLTISRRLYHNSSLRSARKSSEHVAAQELPRVTLVYVGTPHHSHD